MLDCYVKMDALLETSDDLRNVAVFDELHLLINHHTQCSTSKGRIGKPVCNFADLIQIGFNVYIDFLYFEQWVVARHSRYPAFPHLGALFKSNKLDAFHYNSCELTTCFIRFHHHDFDWTVR